jgi:dihydropteroate synthase
MGGPIRRVGDLAFHCAERVLVMGMLNVTRTPSRTVAGTWIGRVAHACGWSRCDILDVGGESTRPGSEAVSAEEELSRVRPVIERLVEQHPAIPVSIDTRKADVAAAALDAGATIVNDVSGGVDPKMFDVVREREAALVLMHMNGDPKTMQEAPGDDVVGEVQTSAKGSGGQPRGIAPTGSCDPGIGPAGPRSEPRADARWVAPRPGWPVLVGPSRKRFIAILDLPEDERVEGTIGAVVWMVGRGAHIVRVHDVREVVRAVRVADAIARAG